MKHIVTSMKMCLHSGKHVKIVKDDSRYGTGNGVMEVMHVVVCSWTSFHCFLYIPFLSAQVSLGHNLPTLKMASLGTQRLHWWQKYRPVRPKKVWHWCGMPEPQALEVGKRALESAARLQSVMSVSHSMESIIGKFHLWWESIGRHFLTKATHENHESAEGAMPKGADSEDDEDPVEDIQKQEQEDAIRDTDANEVRRTARLMEELETEVKVKEDIAKAMNGQPIVPQEEEDDQPALDGQSSCAAGTSLPTVAGMLKDAGVSVLFVVLHRPFLIILDILTLLAFFVHHNFATNTLR